MKITPKKIALAMPSSRNWHSADCISTFVL